MQQGQRAVQVMVVEDDPQLRVLLATALGEQGILVTLANDAATAHRIARDSELDVVLLDLGLPDRDGSELIPALRSVNDAAIIVISARDSEQQKIAALDAGADDYLTKPFGIGELLARIRTALRRRAAPPGQAEASGRYEFDRLVIDIAARLVTLDGAPVHLTPLEFRMLAALVRRNGQVLTHRQLLREVWGPLHEDDTHYLRIYMRQLRAKLEAEPAQPRYLLTEPGVGYRLATE